MAERFKAAVLKTARGFTLPRGFESHPFRHLAVHHRRPPVSAGVAGDVLMVTRLDRLARSTRDLLNILDAVGKAGAAFKSLGDAWADTTTQHGRLMLTVLGGLAEFERELILARTGAGRARAKAQGVRFGRPPSLTSHQRREAMERLAHGAAQAELARSYGVSQSTISRLAAPGPFEASAVGA